MMNPTPRSETWKWTVCGMLLLATMLNYMDRMTLNQTAPRIMKDFGMNAADYGYVEGGFALAFAGGAILGGLCADRWNVWWIYPTAVFFWSLAGTVTGFAFDFASLFACRFFLGLTEAFHWPCALRTTQRILPNDQRSLGNSILQSGAAVGALITPLVVLALVELTDTWRYPFYVVGAMGLFWVVAWLKIVRPADLALPTTEVAPIPGEKSDTLWNVLIDPRFWVLIIVVTAINGTWHFFRVWMPLFLNKTHGYSEREYNLFLSAYYLSADAGSLAAGFATLFLIRKGFGIHFSRMMVFTSCALLSGLAILVPFLPTGWLLLGVLMVIAFATLGLFPNYYTFSQEMTVKHQGKVSGILGCANWLALAAMHPLMGLLVEETNSYALGLTVAGMLPLIATAALLIGWRESTLNQASAGRTPSDS